MLRLSTHKTYDPTMKPPWTYFAVIYTNLCTTRALPSFFLLSVGAMKIAAAGYTLIYVVYQIFRVCNILIYWSVEISSLIKVNLAELILATTRDSGRRGQIVVLQT